MRIVEQEERPSFSVEDLLELLRAKNEKGTHPPERERAFLTGLPIAKTALGIMVVALGAMVIILKSDIAVLKSDMTDLKNLKAQVATLDPKTQFINIDNKLEDIGKEKEVMKGEIAQFHAEVEAIKTERKKENNKIPNRLKGRQPSTNNTARAMKNEEVLLRKTSSQDMFFSDVSRATSFDPPPK
jgi:hypothetical protein